IHPRTVTQGHAALAGTCGFSPMSRLRRVDLHSRFFFITCSLERGVRPLNDREFRHLDVGRAGSAFTSSMCRSEFDRTIEYIQENPAVKDLVEDSVDWKWSSAAWYANRTGPIEIDDVRLPQNPVNTI